MATPTEQRILQGIPDDDGRHFDGTRSPTRSVSPSILAEGDSATGNEGNPASSLRGQNPHHGGPKTGVKGVRADARAHSTAAQAQRAAQIEANNRRMKSMALGNQQTWVEDEESRRQAAEGDSDDAELEAIRRKRLEEMKSTHQVAANEARRRRLAGEDTPQQNSPKLGVSNTSRSKGLFGHLREAGPTNYAQAIDGEDPATIIVVHIYVKYIHACSQVTAALSSLARINPTTKFLSVQASSIGFGSGGPDSIDLDDELSANEKAEDIVPTILIYQGGKLLANLVRVDLHEKWGHGEERDMRNILAHYGAVGMNA